MTQILVDECWSIFNSPSDCTLTVVYTTTNTGLLSAKFYATPTNAYQQVDNIGLQMLGNNKYSFEVNYVIPSAYVKIAINSNNEGWTGISTIYTIDDPNYESEHAPPYMPFIRDQAVWYWDTLNYYGEAGTCAACAISTMKEIHEYKESRGAYSKYSVGWIYGNRKSTDYQGEGLMVGEALDKLKDDGTPNYLIIPENAHYTFADNYYYLSNQPNGITAKQLVDNNYSNILSSALPQRIASWSMYTNWEVSSVKNRVLQDGCVLLSLSMYINPYNYDINTGIFTEYGAGTYDSAHTVTIIGWKKINNLNYWICAGSWGYSCGDYGLYYIPFFVAYSRWYYFVTDGQYPTAPPPIPSSAPTGSRREGGFYLYWGSSTDATGYTLKVRRGYDSVTTYINTTSPYGYNVTGLQFGVTYFLSVCAYNSSGSSAYTSENQLTTAPKTPVISGSVNQNIATISITNMCDNWSEVKVYRYDDSYNMLDSKTIYYPNTSISWTGLTSGTTYRFRAISSVNINESWIYSYAYSSYITLNINIRPSLFYWDTTKTSGNTFDVKASEWNRLIQNIRDIYTYKGIPSYTPTLYDAVSGNSFTAINDFNRIKNAIGYFYNSADPATGVGISDKSAGNTVYASYLDGSYSIVSKLNGIT